jgi:hypothetical protein
VNDPPHLFENCRKPNWCHRIECVNDTAHLYENCKKKSVFLGKRKNTHTNEVGQSLNQMAVTPPVSSSNKPYESKRVHYNNKNRNNNNNNNNKTHQKDGMKKLYRQIDAMNSRMMSLEKASGDISGASHESQIRR